VLPPYSPTPSTLLKAAAQALEPRQPQWKALFYCDGFSYLARFDWPGVVRVFKAVTGEQMAQSEPGRPLVPAVGVPAQAPAQHGRRTL
jgi:hypothetical protein